MTTRYGLCERPESDISTPSCDNLIWSHLYLKGPLLVISTNTETCKKWR